MGNDPVAYNFANRLDRLGVRMKEVNSRTVTYNRPDVGSISDLQATCVEHDATELLALGMPVDIKLRMYHVDVAELKIGGSCILPEPGDKITDGGLVIRLIPLGPDQPAFKYTTQSRKRIIIGGEVISQTDLPCSSSSGSGSTS